jgi:translation initiation factor 1
VEGFVTTVVDREVSNVSSKLVWTSDPDQAKKLRGEGKLDPARDIEPSKQRIRVTLDRKRRAGKTITVASGFEHTPESLARLAATLKKKCGAGGTAKEGEIEIQGDHAKRVAEELAKLGYAVR